MQADRNAADGAKRVSVVIPAYNSAAYIAETLHSVLSQSLPPAEIIVVDDGSSDDTAAIARSFGVTVMTVANGGPSAARNSGVRAATGEYIAFLDADDIWVADKLALQLDALESFGRPAFSFTDYREFDENGPRKCPSQLLRHAEFRRAAKKPAGVRCVVMEDDGREPILFGTSYIAPSTVMIRRADILAVGGFDESLRYSEDFEFFLRLFRHRPALVLMSTLLLYRKHSASLTANWVQRPSYIHVARRVAAAPHRYPRGEVNYIARTGHLRHLRIAEQFARYGQFEDAARSSRASLAERWTPRASLILAGSRLFSNSAGRASFEAVRSLWKSRPGRR